MSNLWEESQRESPSPPEQPPSEGPPPPAADWSLDDEARAAATAAPRSHWGRMVAVGAALSVLLAFGLVIAVNSREGGIHAAMASVFSSPTLKVVFTAHTTNQSQEATLASIRSP